MGGLDRPPTPRNSSLQTVGITPPRCQRRVVCWRFSFLNRPDTARITLSTVGSFGIFGVVREA